MPAVAFPAEACFHLPIPEAELTYRQHNGA